MKYRYVQKRDDIFNVLGIEGWEFGQGRLGWGECSLRVQTDYNENVIILIY